MDVMIIVRVEDYARGEWHISIANDHHHDEHGHYPSICFKRVLLLFLSSKGLYVTPSSLIVCHRFLSSLSLSVSPLVFTRILLRPIGDCVYANIDEFKSICI